MDNPGFPMRVFNDINETLSNTDLQDRKEILFNYRADLNQELEQILQYWVRFTVDNINGGFVGRIDHENKIFLESPKGSVLNSRILWSFSAAYNLTKKREYLQLANRAYRYLIDYFLDVDFGGVYWAVNHKGEPQDTKKQVYALAFAVYGLSEYFHATHISAAKERAIEIYNVIVRYSHDEKFGGYREAYTRDWKQLDDLRLSNKDANAPKSMNTHLHLLEAFSSLYRIWPDDTLKEKIRELIQLFIDHIISKNSHHLNLFFDDEWNSRSSLISYGHDIEAAWLIQEAAQAIDDKTLFDEMNNRSLLLSHAASKGLDADGGLWYEYESETGTLVKEKHWWPQAEAMVGFFNAWQITGNENELGRSLRNWEFVKRFIHDKKGEWKWGVYEDYSRMDKEDKVGIWKCPYHNSRACLEIIRRINELIT